MTARPLPVLLALVAAALSPGCRQILGIPSDTRAEDSDAGQDGADDGIGDDGADGAGDDAGDGSGGVDAAPGQDALDPCIDGGAGTTHVGFDDPTALDGWIQDIESGCALAVENQELVVRQTSPPARCRAFGPIAVRMNDIRLGVRLDQSGDPNTNAIFSIVLSDGTADIRSRRRITIERDGGEIHLGECTGESCDRTAYGSFPYVQAQHLWWSGKHSAGDERIYFEFAMDNEIYVSTPGALPVTGITSNLVDCVGIELGSDETDGDASTIVFDDVVTGG